MDTNTEKTLAVMVWLGLMAAVIVACTLPEWCK